MTRTRSGLRRASGVDDVQVLAARRLPKAVLDFVEGGAEDEFTIGRNRQALQALSFVPRVLTDVSRRSQSTTLLGTPVSSPVVLAPVGLAALAHPAGEVAAAQAAAAAGVVSTLSSSSAWSLEDVARSCTGPKWFQLYIWRDRELTCRVVERARVEGFRALCLTVDVPVAARRQRDLRNGFTVPPRPRLSQAGDLLRHAGWCGGRGGAGPAADRDRHDARAARPADAGVAGPRCRLLAGRLTASGRRAHPGSTRASAR